MLRVFISVFLISLFSIVVEAQGYSFYENSQFDPFQRETYVVGTNKLHSSLRMYKLDELREFYDLDSLIYAGIYRPDVYLNPHEATDGKPISRNVFRNFIHDDFLAWKYQDSYVAINPYCNFQIGKENGSDHTSYINSRGFYVNGNLGKNFWFYMDFTENQSRYPDYYEEIANGFVTVPGESNYKKESDYYDYEVANGYIGFNIGKHVDFQIGKGKVFIGDGYRSLLLSDNAPAYPMFKFNLTFLNCKYMMMITQLQTHDAQGVSNNGHREKYSFTHYFDWNMWGRFSLGIFENVTMAAWRLTGESRNIDMEYINPFIIFRPGEYNAGSPDKMIVGFNSKLVLAKSLILHGQLMFNEFRLKELTAKTGYWSNKYGCLVGLKSIDLFGAPGLDMQLEYSQVRPFSYSQYDGLGCYTHHRQSLAHPLGANFKEFVGILNYRYRRLMLHTQFNLAKYGDDIPGDTLSYGHDPNIPSKERNAQYGVHMLQGNKTTVKYADMSATVLINPRNMMNLTMGVRMRNMNSDFQANKSTHMYVALRWSLKNTYYDY